MKFSNLSLSRNWRFGASTVALAVLILVQPLCASSAKDEEKFGSPEDAVAALTKAATAKDTNGVHKIFGHEGHELISPDMVQANTGFTRFSERVTEKVEMIHESDSKIVLDLGNEAWPFPIPLVKEGDKWFFDVEAGKDEILNRRIGGDELGAIAVCQTYVEAQREYAARAHNGDDVMEYAQHLRSDKGKHNGLYWPAKNPTDEVSPFGPLITGAREEGYHASTGMMTDKETPYHGYYFKILTKQGKSAPGGKFDYIINGHMLAGYAMIAWPAEWGNTGVMTFIVNQQGKVYQKNFGPSSANKAKAVTVYDPDSTWTPVSGK